ncbi:hypothetical protein NLU13_7646 [Sarocladium strictum]|uniref:BYS1 domain protein n=1 Tax=Sarocladium strictum TaxID=5046 RepID=A0AA39GED1_SARSR|nr:hypothetical protein NLU13_7646 [Sarocladium strictum]
MVKFNALALTAALVGLSQAVGQSKVTNNCDSSVYLWVVGSNQDGPYEVKPGKQWKKTYFHDAKTGGVAIKVARQSDGLPAGDPHTIFSYTLDPDRVWYDLSNVFGDPFEGENLLLRGAPPCPSIEWPEGVPTGGRSQTLRTVDCGPDKDTNLYLCGLK